MATAVTVVVLAYSMDPAAAIEQADLVIIAPGDLYTSLGPLLVIDGIGDALRRTKATVAYVSNLVTKEGQTAGFTVSDHASEIERFAGGKCLDYVIYNEERPTASVAERYKAEGAYLVEYDKDALERAHYRAIGGHFIGGMAEGHAADILPVTRSLIRHDAKQVAKTLLDEYRRLPKG